MNKIEIYDILERLEDMLSELSSPIDSKIVPAALINDKYVSIRELFNPNIAHILEDQCFYLLLYRMGKKQEILNNNFEYKSLFFCTPTNLELLPFTEYNLLKEFKSTLLESYIIKHLRKYKLSDKNKKTGRLLIMDLLDSIDPEPWT